MRFPPAKGWISYFSVLQYNSIVNFYHFVTIVATGILDTMNQGTEEKKLSPGCSIILVNIFWVNEWYPLSTFLQSRYHEIEERIKKELMLVITIPCRDYEPLTSVSPHSFRHGGALKKTPFFGGCHINWDLVMFLSNLLNMRPCRYHRDLLCHLIFLMGRQSKTHSVCVLVCCVQNYVITLCFLRVHLRWGKTDSTTIHMCRAYPSVFTENCKNSSIYLTLLLNTLRETLSLS